MKKYITIAALLAAGSAFANAADEITATDYTGAFAWSANTTPTFTFDSNSECPLSITLSTEETYKSTNYQSGTFTPNKNVGQGNDWTLTLTVKNIDKDTDITISSIQFTAFVFNVSGNNQLDDEKDRSVKFSLSDVEDTESLTFKKTNGKNDPQAVTFSFATPIELVSGTSKAFALTVENNNADTGTGTFVGLNAAAFSVSNVPSVPEPSAFGLLAGIGALALVASRRRRK